MLTRPPKVEKPIFQNLTGVLQYRRYTGTECSCVYKWHMEPISMEPKAIDFEVNDVSFDYVIDIKFVREVSYRRRRVYGMPPNYFVVG